jgi:hypothetical protein
MTQRYLNPGSLPNKYSNSIQVPQRVELKSLTKTGWVIAVSYSSSPTDSKTLIVVLSINPKPGSTSAGISSTTVGRHECSAVNSRIRPRLVLTREDPCSDSKNSLFGSYRQASMIICSGMKMPPCRSCGARLKVIAACGSFSSDLCSVSVIIT